jgi:hypothetical protein
MLKTMPEMPFISIAAPQYGYTGKSGICKAGNMVTAGVYCLAVKMSLYALALFRTLAYLFIHIMK